ncbi:hypothetical protein [Streptomyces sp. Ac-502]|uniref:hypothetical protein n=1 Tax=Streptomyces sp. Ac-502 TaxID=3342801 RepID=UPI0038622C7D
MTTRHGSSTTAGSKSSVRPYASVRMCRRCRCEATTDCRICRAPLCAACTADHHHEGYGTPASS